MGLKGQLEDLPLIDMLQIVAFSKKSGYLTVSSPSGRGAVVLEEGRVLFAYSWSTVKGLRELARQPQRITPELIREHIEASLRELTGTREGSFQFELAESISDELGGVNIKPFVLAGGLDPQELLLDLAVELDNERQETTTLLELAYHGNPPPSEIPLEPPMEDDAEEEEEDEVLEPVSTTPPPSAAPESRETAADAPPAPRGSAPRGPWTIVLVDDEALVVEVVGRELRAKGYRVAAASTPAGGAELARGEAAKGSEVLVVLDLKMPTSSGRSFYGGFELIRRLRKAGHELPVLLMVESLTDKARTRAKELGVRRVVHKPTLTKLDPDLYRADLKEFSEAVAQQLDVLVGDRDGTSPALVASDPGPGGARPEFISEMTKKLVELRGSTDVSRLVLHVAERFLERGVLFVVKSDVAKGLAGFGIASSEKACAELAQGIVMEISASLPLEEVVRTGSTLRVADRLEAFGELFSRIGQGRGREAVLIPLLYNRATLLLLYGDNAATGRPVPDVSDLELFIAQAGMALENKLLQRKLSSVESHVGEKLGEDAALGSR